MYAHAVPSRKVIHNQTGQGPSKADFQAWGILLYVSDMSRHTAVTPDNLDGLLSALALFHLD